MKLSHDGKYEVPKLLEPRANKRFDSNYKSSNIFIKSACHKAYLLSLITLFLERVNQHLPKIPSYAFRMDSSEEYFRWTIRPFLLRL